MVPPDTGDRFNQCHVLLIFSFEIAYVINIRNTSAYVALQTFYRLDDDIHLAIVAEIIERNLDSGAVLCGRLKRGVAIDKVGAVHARTHVLGISFPFHIHALVHIIDVLAHESEIDHVTLLGTVLHISGVDHTHVDSAVAIHSVERRILSDLEHTVGGHLCHDAILRQKPVDRLCLLVEKFGVTLIIITALQCSDREKKLPRSPLLL